MKLMITSAVAGIALFALGITLGNELISINPMRVLLFTAAVLFIIGGIAGIVDIWQNRGMRFRKTRKGSRA
jgi:uncharacterized membrane protein